MQDPTPLVLLFVAIIAVVVVANVFARRRRKLRAGEMQSFASLHGFRSEGDANPFAGLNVNRPQPATGVPEMLFEIAARRGMLRNVLRGTTAAGETILFDYQAPSADGTPSPDGAFMTLALYRVPGIPELQMFPQGRFSFGIKDIDFPSHPRFSKRFMLLGNDEAAIRKLFSSSVLEACEALSEKREWSLQGSSDLLLVTFGQTREGELQELVEQSARVAAAMQ